MSIGTVKLDWNEYIKAARDVIDEGCVLLENKDSALPLKKGSRVSLFGRMQLHYYKSGTGSGGMVNVSRIYDVLDGLRESGEVEINEKLLDIYKKWEEEHPFNEGLGWGTEPWSQEEMVLDEAVVNEAACFSDTAIIIIGRTAGEDKDFSDVKGAFRLSDEEEIMMEKVCKAFKKSIVLLNVGSVMDLDFIDKYNPSAVMFIWQGGMIGGLGTADVLLGKVSPSGKLPDTVAYKMEDYAATEGFNEIEKAVYTEDIYVGYRYFETFAKDKVRFPFGYGLSYTTFETMAGEGNVDRDAKKVYVEALVKNVGERSGKEVVQVYMNCPQGKLGKPVKVLVDFDKTSLLQPGEEEKTQFEIDFSSFASFDDKGVTDYPFSFVLESGKYTVYVGTDAESNQAVFSFDIENTVLIKKLSDSLGPHTSFRRLKPCTLKENGCYELEYEETPLAGTDEDVKRKENIPVEIKQDLNARYSLKDVAGGTVSIEQFVSQLSDEDLACMVRGEGMGSSLVTPGTAAAFGGVSEKLRNLDLPAICCDDGPSGMRLDSGVKAFSLPGGFMISSTFNPEIVTKLYEFLSLEMIHNKVDVLLGPGINIHRHPLNGRNFEYFSEDPLLTGRMAVAELMGLKKNGVSGTVKHFCGNNRENKRHTVDSVISERALREIYLKNFEIAVESGCCDSVMTTYGQVNGRWTSGNYDLNTTILRNEWGFRGVVMTDWWAYINERGGAPSKNDTATMVRAQNDIYMVVDNSERNTADDNSISSLKSGTLERSELQKCAMNICSFALESQAMKRVLGQDYKVEIEGKEEDDETFDATDVTEIYLDDEVTVPLDHIDWKAGTNFLFRIIINGQADYRVTLSGLSDMGELAQLPCTVYVSGIPYASFTFNGSGGQIITRHKDVNIFTSMSLYRINMAKNGLKLKSISFKKI